jgi:Kef-type K+ transport system membrane component KefB
VLTSLAFVFVAAVLSPLIADRVRRVVLPIAVVEVVLGIVAGPQVLDLIHLEPVVLNLSQFGLAFLFFLAGQEVDIERIKGRPASAALVGWAVGFVLALGAATLGHRLGLDATPLDAALAISTTTLGALLPILSDAGQLSSATGRYVMAAGAVGEFVPIVIIAVLLNRTGGALVAVLLLNGFFLVVAAGVVVARRWRPARLSRVIGATMHSSAQLAIRISLLLLVVLVALATRWHLDMLLGAFAAGVMVRQVTGTVRGTDREPDLHTLEAKFAAIGYGLAVPVFFVVTGAQFDLDALLHDPSSMVLLVVALGLFLLLRGAPTALLAARGAPRGLDGRALTLFTATQLPLVIVVTGDAVAAHKMSSAVAAALVGAGMLSMLLFPTLGLRRLPAPVAADVLQDARDDRELYGDE